MEGSKGRGTDVTPCCSQQARPLKYLPMLLLLLLGGALTVVWPQCHGAEETSDDAATRGLHPPSASVVEEPTSPKGYDVPPSSALEEVTYPDEYKGHWLVVKVERTGLWRRWAKMFRTKPSRVKKLSRPGLHVFEMKCFARGTPAEDRPSAEGNALADKRQLLFQKRMNKCREQMEVKGVAAGTPMRRTYVIPEHYRKWIKKYLNPVDKLDQRETDYGNVTVFFNCQLPGDDDSLAACHGDTISEFNPALVHQYYHNTLRVNYHFSGSLAGPGAEPIPLSLGEVDGNVIVGIQKDTAFSEGSDAWQGVSSGRFSIPPRERNGEQRSEGSDERPVAIRTNCLTRPQIDFSTHSEDMPGRLVLRKNKVDPIGTYGFRVQEEGQGTPSVAYPVQPQTAVTFDVMPIPEIYMYSPAGHPGITRRGRNRAGHVTKGTPIHVRLQKKSFFSRAKERGNVVVTCGTKAREVAKCLKAHQEIWKHQADVAVFLSSGNINHLKTFLHEALSQERHKQFTEMGLPEPKDWSYVLEGGLTGKTKLFEKRVVSTDFDEEEIREMVMAGVTKSPVLKTTFQVPLFTSYVKVRAAIPKVSTDTSSSRCDGDLRVTFNPQIRKVEYKIKQTDAHSSGGWELLEYKNNEEDTEGSVVLTLGLTERFIYDEATDRQQPIPIDWQEIRIRRNDNPHLSAVPEPLVTKIECPGQNEDFKQSIETTETLVLKWEQDIRLFSPRVVDDVSPPAENRGFFSRIFGWMPFRGRRG